MKKPLYVSDLSKWILPAFLILLWGCGGNDLDEVERVTLDKEKVPVETGNNIEVIYTDSGKLSARVLATTMEKFKESESTYLEMPDGVQAYFFNDQQERSSELKADYGIRYLNENKTIVKNDVLVVNRKGDTLETEKLTWDEKKNRISSDQFVKVTTSDEIIYAQGLESNLSFTEYEFYNIEGTIQIED